MASVEITKLPLIIHSATMLNIITLLKLIRPGVLFTQIHFTRIYCRVETRTTAWWLDASAQHAAGGQVLGNKLD